MTSLIERVLSQHSDPLSRSLLAVVKKCSDPRIANMVYILYRQYSHHIRTNARVGGDSHEPSTRGQ